MEMLHGLRSETILYDNKFIPTEIRLNVAYLNMIVVTDV